MIAVGIDGIFVEPPGVKSHITFTLIAGLGPGACC